MNSKIVKIKQQRTEREKTDHEHRDGTITWKDHEQEREKRDHERC